ncbi:MAG: hypothetical protein SPE18_04735 [Candidatus Limivicinus sp.]|nr:hypothetical protein [Candidatus Limivicinus sp.]
MTIKIPSVFYFIYIFLNSTFPLLERTGEMIFHHAFHYWTKKEEKDCSLSSWKSLISGVFLLEVTLQQTFEGLAVTGLVANLSDFVPIAGIARAFGTACGTCSSGRACAAVFVQLTALFTLPARLFF